jgi:hypothetical protein
VTVEHQDVLNKLEAMIEKLENLSLQQQTAGPKRQKVVDELLTEARDTIESVIRWQRRRENEAQIAELLEAIDNNTTKFLEAINTNTETTNNLLAVSEVRLRQVERELAEQDGGSAFEADPAVLAEGQFLTAQLAGVQGTEGRGPLFKDAPVIRSPSGLEVLADAVTKPDETGGVE